MTMDISNIDLAIKYVLAAAGQEDPGSQEVGPIHLIKYVYLGDLAYAEANEGRTFTGCNWQFYHFGPWCREIHQRIEPVVADVQAREKRITSPKVDTDIIRYRLVDDALYEQLDRLLPFELTRAVKRAIHEFGSDTYGLLDFVYKTDPILNAAPGESLFFRPLVCEAVSIDESAKAEEMKTEKKSLTAKEQKRRKEKLDALREKIRARLKEKLESAETAVPEPAPRYDEVFMEGQKWLDQLAGDPIEESSGELIISDTVWKSRARSEKEIS